MRQLALASILYANANKGRLMPNANAEGKMPSSLWYDIDRIGKYLPNTATFSSGSIATPVMICPDAPDGTIRAYAMNIWGSSAANSYVYYHSAVARSVPSDWGAAPWSASTAPGPYTGSMWDMNTRGSSVCILFCREIHADKQCHRSGDQCNLGLRRGWNNRDHCRHAISRRA